MLGRTVLSVAHVLTVLTAASMPSLAADEAAIPTILVEADSKGVTVVGRVVALTSGTFSSTLKIDRQGVSGRTATTQGGESRLGAGEAADIARVGLSMGAGDTLDVRMVVSAGGREVASSQLTVGAARK